MLKIKPINNVGKLTLVHLKKNLDDFSRIDSHNIFGNCHRINFFNKDEETKEEKIVESYWVKVSDGKLISCEKD